MATLNIEQAAEFLHISTSRLAEKASKGLVPAYKPFKSWLFFEAELEQFVRNQQCHSISKPVQNIGLSISLSKASELDDLLAPRPSKRLRNITTG